MIKIYCLVDPRSNKPFYVGATKVSLKNRISGHIQSALVFTTTDWAKPLTAFKKHSLIKELAELNLKPRADLLYICSIRTVDYYEQFFYNLLVYQGFELLNWKHYFNYSKYGKIDWYQYQ